MKAKVAEANRGSTRGFPRVRIETKLTSSPCEHSAFHSGFPSSED